MIELSVVSPDNVSTDFELLIIWFQKKYWLCFKSNATRGSPFLCAFSTFSFFSYGVPNISFRHPLLICCHLLRDNNYGCGSLLCCTNYYDGFHCGFRTSGRPMVRAASSVHGEDSRAP